METITHPKPEKLILKKDSIKKILKIFILLSFISFILFNTCDNTLTKKNKSRWNSFNTHLVMGKQDYLINDEMKAKFLSLISNYKLNYKLTQYDGDHRIFPEVMLKLAQSL